MASSVLGGVTNVSNKGHALTAAWALVGKQLPLAKLLLAHGWGHH